MKVLVEMTVAQAAAVADYGAVDYWATVHSLDAEKNRRIAGARRAMPGAKAACEQALREAGQR